MPDGLDLRVVAVKSLDEVSSWPIITMHFPPPARQQTIGDAIVCHVANDRIASL